MSHISIHIYLVIYIQMVQANYFTYSFPEAMHKSHLVISLLDVYKLLYSQKQYKDHFYSQKISRNNFIFFS